MNAGTPITIVEEPEEAGEVDQDLANRLWAGGMAIYADEFRPTPVETLEQEAARLTVTNETRAAEAEALGVIPSDPEVTDDLSVWQQDDEELGKKAGDRVTNDDLRVIAEREGVETETDDNKGDLQGKILAGRAARAEATFE